MSTTSTSATIADIILALDGCDEAWQWANTLPDTTTVEQAWESCPNASWLFWLLLKRDGDNVRLAMVSCARVLLPILSDGPDKDTCERYLDSVDRAIRNSSGDADDCLQQDAMALWDVVVMSDGDTREGAVYEAVDLADTVSYESMLVLAEAALGLHYSALLATMADRVRIACPWSSVGDGIHEVITEAMSRGIGG
jgi:hypothetical protein